MIASECRWRGRTGFALACLGLPGSLLAAPQAAPGWRLHEIHRGHATLTVVAGDFTGDDRIDIVANNDGATRLFAAPDWKETVLHRGTGNQLIHSEVFDVDRDGDLDFIGARYQPGWIHWLENPGEAGGEWRLRVISSRLNGIHGLLRGDVDGDGRTDLIANSAQPRETDFPESVAWFSVPADPGGEGEWTVRIAANRDAPGLSHYLGLGDVNGDGRADIATAAKGKPSLHGNWFAWWEAPDGFVDGWRRHLIAENQVGATNIFPADVNGDGQTDFIATRGHGEGVIWFEAPGWRERPIHPTLREPHTLQVLDFDGDGDIDAVTCAFGDRLAYWFENDGRGNFRQHLVATDQAAYDVRAVDMDDDGDTDVVIAGQRSENVAWYENLGSGP